MHGNGWQSSSRPLPMQRHTLKHPFCFIDIGMRAYEPIGTRYDDVSPNGHPVTQRNVDDAETLWWSCLLSGTHTSVALHVCPRHGEIIWWFAAGQLFCGTSLGSKYGLSEIHGDDTLSESTENFAQTDSGVCRVSNRVQSIHLASKS